MRPCCYNSFQYSGKAFTRLWNVSMGIFVLPSRGAFMRSDTDAGWECLACSLCSSLSQRCSVGLRSDLCACRSSTSNSSTVAKLLRNLLCMLGQSETGTLKGLHQTAPTKLDAENCLKNGSESWSIKISHSFKSFKFRFICIATNHNNSCLKVSFTVR